MSKLNEIIEKNEIRRASMLINMANQLMTAFDQEFREDVEAKKYAMDALIELINRQKDVSAKPA